MDIFETDRARIKRRLQTFLPILLLAAVCLIFYLGITGAGRETVTKEQTTLKRALEQGAIHELTKNLNTTFENLLKEQIELHVADGMILPDLKMTDKDVCPFLKEKRCSIHSFRPGICRVFPLGRIYEENRLDYFLQVDGCAKENRSKIKVSKWLDTPELKKNQQYLIDWHAFRKKIKSILGEMSDENQKKTITMFLLNTFYINPYDMEQDFYPQFYARLDRIAQVIA